jgi:nascent polypeptide-associated complex subunit alpha
MQERMLSSLGVSMEELGLAKEVTIELQDRTIKISGPAVVAINSQAGRIYQIVGGEEFEPQKEELGKPAYEPSPEDIALVAAQAGVEPDEARRALIESGGDLARAIMSLRTQKT